MYLELWRFGILGPLFLRCAGTLTLALSYSFNSALNSFTFPNAWKISRIIPVYKNGPKTDFTNYGPIRIEYNFSKIFESIIYNNIYCGA